MKSLWRRYTTMAVFGAARAGYGMVKNALDGVGQGVNETLDVVSVAVSIERLSKGFGVE